MKADFGWLKWFAWRPVRLAGQKPGNYSWLCFVERYWDGKRYRYRRVLQPGEKRDALGEMTRL